MCLSLSAALLFHFDRSLRTRQDLAKSRRSLAFFKGNEAIFKYLLQRERPVPDVKMSYNMVLGNPRAKHELIMVSNLNCQPCMAKYLRIRQLQERFDSLLKVRIIFSENTFDEPSLKNYVIPTFLSTAINQPEHITTLFDSWYSHKQHGGSVESWSAPVQNLYATGNDQLAILFKEIRLWNQEAEITHTPTLYFNGFLLPEVYALEDLRYFLQ